MAALSFGLDRLAYVFLAHLARFCSHGPQRRLRSESGNGIRQVLVFRVTALLLNRSILVAMAIVQAGFFHGFTNLDRSLTNGQLERTEVCRRWRKYSMAGCAWSDFDSQARNVSQ